MAHRKQAWSKRVKKDRFKKKYLTRMQATRLLQTDSMGFRRLCILKGIYPRAIGKSKQKLSGNDKQYYLTKEIKWLVRDHLQEKIMSHLAWEKRIRRAKAMNLQAELLHLNSRDGKPTYNLAATIKERYPFFNDAVKDIDDAMSMIALYAFLTPEVHSQSTIDFHKALPSGLHDKAKSVVSQWLSYVERAQVLTKGFVSIKGYYYEAIVKGERVRWLMPHEYASKFPSGIQQYILITFLEFYIEMMRFVLFKLNTDLDKELEERDRIEEDVASSPPDETAESIQTNSASRDASQKKELQRVSSLFQGLTFYVSREVPAKHIHLVVLSCGGHVVNTFGGGVTHYVVDRPAAPHKKESFVEYIQPQYIFDCLNARTILPVQGYGIGETLPPHVSPFTVAISNLPEDTAVIEETKKAHPKVVSYVPERAHEIRRVLDPTYVSIDPKKEAEQLDGELSDDEHAPALELEDNDAVSLSGDEIEDATKQPEWEDEQVAENVTRGKLSAYQVQKQRELNLMNQPSKPEHALKRQIAAQQALTRNRLESNEARIKRKLSQKAKEEAATKKMQLQVARKKAARYYKMVNSVVAGNKKKEDILTKKAQQLNSGKTTMSEGTIVSKSKQDRRDKIKKRVEDRGEDYDPKRNRSHANPYKKLPKWVR